MGSQGDWFPCYKSRCSDGQFCNTKAKLCLPCNKYDADCFTENHKLNCTKYCGDLFKQKLACNFITVTSTDFWDDNWPWIAVILAMFALFVTVFIIVVSSQTLTDILRSRLQSVSGFFRECIWRRGCYQKVHADEFCPEDGDPPHPNDPQEETELKTQDKQNEIKEEPQGITDGNDIDATRLPHLPEQTLSPLDQSQRAVSSIKNELYDLDSDQVPQNNDNKEIVQITDKGNTSQLQISAVTTAKIED